MEKSDGMCYNTEKSFPEANMSILLVFLMILLYTFQSSFCNMYARHYPGDKKNSSTVYSVFYGVIVAAVTFVIAGFSLKPTAATLILGCLNGAVLVLYNTMLIKASSSGPYSVTMIFNLFGGIILPMLVSVFIDGAKLSLWQFISIAVMLIAFVFLNMEDKKSGEKISVIFILYCVVLALANGFYGVLLNSQKLITNASEDAEMIVITFAVSSILAFTLLAVKNGKETLPAFRQNKKSILSILAASVSAATAVNLLMYCLSLMNVAVLYTLTNGGVLIVSILWSAVILREKLGRTRIIGLILAIAAIFALSIL